MDQFALQFTPFLMPIMGAAIVLTLLAIYAWRRGQATPGSTAFTFLLILSAWWCYTYALELMTTDPTTLLFWVRLEWISIALLPVSWLLFALAYAGHTRWVNLPVVMLLVAIPVVMIALAWTTPSHAWLYVNPGVRDVGGIVVFSAERGPAYIIHVIYSYLLVLTATGLIIRVWFRSTGPQRQLASIVAVGAILPILSNAIYQFGIFGGLPIYVDLTVPAFAFSAVLFSWAWFRLHLFDLVPELIAPVPAFDRLDAALATQSTQTRSLNLASLGLSILLFLTLAPIFTLLLREPATAGGRIAAYTLIFLFLLAIALWRDGSYLLRTIGLALVYLGLALLDLQISGLSPIVGFFLVTFAAFAAVLLPLRLATPVVVIGIVIVGLVAMNASAEVRPFPGGIYALSYLLLSLAMTAGMVVLILVVTRRDIRTLLRLARRLSRDLEVERAQLEERVAERTRALETSAAVSRRLSTILDQRQLVHEVVELLRDAFSYYHVHIFLWDEALGALRMVGGTGEAGQAMLIMGHTLTPDVGLVGRAFSTNSPVVVPDVTQDPGWLPNRLLPNTRTELAVPITYGDEVMGVLDAQDSEVNGLGPDDSQLLQTIAGQLAVALRNARLLTQIQQEAEQAALINAINRKIAQTTDIEGAMRVAATELSRALEARETAVRLQVVGGNGHDDV